MQKLCARGFLLSNEISDVPRTATLPNVKEEYNRDGNIAESLQCKNYIFLIDYQ